MYDQGFCSALVPTSRYRINNIFYLIVILRTLEFHYKYRRYLSQAGHLINMLNNV